MERRANLEYFVSFAVWRIECRAIVCCDVRSVILFFVVLTLTISNSSLYNAVRGHRTGSNNNGVEDWEDYLRREKNKATVRHITETNRSDGII